jgi:hypothetical protein
MILATRDRYSAPACQDCGRIDTSFARGRFCRHCLSDGMLAREVWRRLLPWVLFVGVILFNWWMFSPK